jgi:hypothetical protein
MVSTAGEGGFETRPYEVDAREQKRVALRQAGMSHQGEKTPARRWRYEKQRPTVRRALTVATGYRQPGPGGLEQKKVPPHHLKEKTP